MFEQGTFHRAFQCEIKRMQFHTRQAADFQFQLLDGFRMTASRLFFWPSSTILCAIDISCIISLFIPEAANGQLADGYPVITWYTAGTYNGIPFAANKRCNCSVNLLF